MSCLCRQGLKHWLAWRVYLLTNFVKIPDSFNINAVAGAHEEHNFCLTSARTRILSVFKCLWNVMGPCWPQVMAQGPSTLGYDEWHGTSLVTASQQSTKLYDGNATVLKAPTGVRRVTSAQLSLSRLTTEINAEGKLTTIQQTLAQYHDVSQWTNHRIPRCVETNSSGSHWPILPSYGLLRSHLCCSSKRIPIYHHITRLRGAQILDGILFSAGWAQISCQHGFHALSLVHTEILLGTASQHVALTLDCTTNGLFHSMRGYHLMVIKSTNLFQQFARCTHW